MILRRFEIYSFDGSEEAVEKFAGAARDCARMIPEVLHSAIGRFTGSTPLNFSWEQAYASPESYCRYMEHPFHANMLDRYLMIDSPECILTDNGLGVGLIGYRCETPEYFLPKGARRVIAMRLVIGQLLTLVNRYPTLVDGAFVIIAWVGIKLILEYLHAAGYVHWEVPKWLSLGLIAVIFAVAFVMAKMEGPVEADPLDEKAEQILETTPIGGDDK